MNATKMTTFILITLASVLVTANAVNGQAKPILFFSDLTSGPKTGWENGSVKGCAVTIWGLNFGSQIASNKINVCGQIIDANDGTFVAEWATQGSANGIPRGLSRTTFWLKPACTDGAGTISITVNGVTSNTLPFTVRSGNIYYVSPSGNDSNTGRTTSAPWRYLQKFTTGMSPGDILYARGGEYTSQNLNGNSAHIMLYGGEGGTPGLEKALIGYPGEWPYADLSKSGGHFVVRQADWGGTVTNDLVFAKFRAQGGGSTMYMVIGDRIRMIGNWAVNLNTYDATGIFSTDNSRYVYMYGNYFNHVGTDNWHHLVYGKTKSAIQGVDTSYQYFAYNEVYDYRDNLGPHGCGGGMLDYSRESDAGAKTTHHIYIHGNWFRSSGGGVFYTEGGVSGQALHHIYIYNNIISNPTTCNTGVDGNIYISGDIDNLHIYNNTFYKGCNPTSGALLVRFDYGRFTNLYSKNNIFVSQNSSQIYYYLDSGSTGSVYSAYDLYYNSPVPTDTRYSITNYLTYNPSLTAPDNNNFTLAPNSPCRDAGTSDVSSIVTVDYLGVPRPQGSRYDIGAYEYIQSDTNPPAFPKNPRMLIP